MKMQILKRQLLAIQKLHAAARAWLTDSLIQSNGGSLAYYEGSSVHKPTSLVGISW